MDADEISTFSACDEDVLETVNDMANEDFTVNEYEEEYDEEEDEEEEEDDDVPIHSDTDNDDENINDEEDEVPIQNVNEDMPKRRRGMTKLSRFRNEYALTSIRKPVLFDRLGRLKGTNRPLFVSFLGDLVRDKVGLRKMTWKKVKPAVKDKLWEVITVPFCIT